VKKVLTILILLCDVFLLNAQNYWQVLPDTGLSIGPWTTRFEDVYFTDSVTGFAVNLGGNIYQTKDAGRNWTTRLITSHGLRSIEFLDDKQTGISGSLSGGVFRSSDGGSSWDNITDSLTDSVLQNQRRICGIAHWKNSFYGVGSWGSIIPKFYKSTDKGLTWKCYYPDTSLISAAVDVCFISQDTGFVTGAHILNNAYRSVVVKTTDGGQTWKRVFLDANIGGRIWKIQALTSQVLVGSIEPFYSDTVAMIKSIDQGESWTILGSGFSSFLSGGQKQTQGVGFVNEKHGWLGGYYHGIYETWDGGLTWDTLNFGLNFNRIFVIDSSHVFVGGNEIYFYGAQLPSPPATSVYQQSLSPHKLFPITPNPSAGKLKIEFDLFSNTTVLLQVANIESKRVWQVAQQRLPAGHYTYYWNGNAAPAGNYIVWLGTDEIPIVQKFTLQH
jgi:photosystem II stability/assembly factor-like uncharacterized protein